MNEEEAAKMANDLPTSEEIEDAIAPIDEPQKTYDQIAQQLAKIRAEYPIPTTENIEKNKEDLVKLDAFQDAETGEWMIGVKCSVRIPVREVANMKKEELLTAIVKKLGVVRKVLDEKLKNKQTLAELLK